jgi:hypothetical protein
VEFENGEQRPYDLVVMATGYTTGLERFIEDDDQLQILTQRSKLAGYGFSPNTVTALGQKDCSLMMYFRAKNFNSLYFCGFGRSRLGGLAYGFLAWDVGEDICKYLGTFNPSQYPAAHPTRMPLTPAKSNRGKYLFSAVLVGVTLCVCFLYK